MHRSYKAFLTEKSLRHRILGTSQLCVDLCAALHLPVEVVAASLYYLQRFLEEFNDCPMEMPLLCASCVLLSWKYWEDYSDMRSLRKLNEICRELYRLLVATEETMDLCACCASHASFDRCDMSSSGDMKDDASPLSDAESCNSSKPPSKLLRTLSKKNLASFLLFDDKLPPYPPTPDRLMNESTPVWFNALRDPMQIKPNDAAAHSDLNDVYGDMLEGFPLRYNAARGRCLSATDWTLRDEGREFNRVKEKIKLYEASLLRCLNFEVGPIELPFESINIASRFLWTEELQCLETEASQSATDSSKGSGLLDDTEQQDSSCVLHDLIELSAGFALDFYRAPFCLLYSGRQIGLVSVWKAAVALGFTCPFKLSVSTVVDNQSVSEVQRSALEREKLTQHELFSSIRLDLRMILHLFRKLYDALVEFETERRFYHLQKKNRDTTPSSNSRQNDDDVKSSLRTPDLINSADDVFPRCLNR